VSSWQLLRGGVTTAAGEVADPLPAAARAPLSHSSRAGASTGAEAAISISCVGIEVRPTKERPAGQRAESLTIALCQDGQFIPRGAVYVHNQ